MDAKDRTKGALVEIEDEQKQSGILSPGSPKPSVYSMDRSEKINHDSPPPLFKEGEQENFADKYDTKKLLLGMQRHIKLIGLCSLIGLILGIAAAHHFLTNYRAESVVLYQEELGKGVSTAGFTMTNLSYATVLDMIILPSHFQAVKSILGLNLSVNQLENMTDVPFPRNNSNLIRIVVSGGNPTQVVDIANTLAKVSVRSSQEFNQKQLQLAVDNYKNQLEIAQQKLAMQLKDIENFKKTNQYFEMNAEYSTLLKKINDAQTQFQTANLNYNSILVEYENLKRDIQSLPDRIPIATNDSRFSPLQMRISTLQAALAEARSKYTKDNPKVIALEEELKNFISQSSNSDESEDTVSQPQEKNPLKERLQVELMRMQGKVRSAQKLKQELALTSEELQKGLKDLPAKQIAFAKLLQNKQIIEDEVKSLNLDLDATQLMLNIPKGSLELYQLADKAKPLKDSWWVNLLPLLGLLFGLGSGMGLAFLREMRDDKICTPTQVGLSYSLPVLAVIPEIPQLTKKNAQEKILPYIRTLAERLEHAVKETPGRHKEKNKVSLTFTSSIEHEGKSWLTYYLSLYYHKIGRKVLLMELTPHRNPFAENTASPAAGIESYLRGKAPYSDIIAKGVPHQIKMEHPDPEMKELVKSEPMNQLWQTLNKEYEIIIVDAPGIMEDNYALNLCTNTDCTVFIAGSSKVPKKVIDESLKELNHFGIRPCGVILNRVDPVYIEDKRTKFDTKKKVVEWLQQLAFWK
jgi:capsular polysaccharide biosynthesis protein/Mrp family chromosome partitioning ATPase